MKIGLDSFPCLLISSDMETSNLVYANQNAKALLGTTFNSDTKLFDILSRASWIFFESYIRPKLIKDGEYTEVQITLVNKHGRKIHAVANVVLEQSVLYWSMFTAEERDKLYQELLLAREHLETQNEELLTLTRKDPLTSLLNRRATTDDFIILTRQLSRLFVPISFLLLDIDRFKQINDEFGHEVGDSVLIELSNTLTRACRDADIVARWGGEEFLIILYNSDIHDATLFSSCLHKEIALLSVPNGEHLTVSIGVTSLDATELREHDLLDKVLKRADEALYLAKQNGRNRTEVIH